MADSFNPNANSAVYSIAVQADGKILAGGDFTTLHRTAERLTRNRIARLETDGRLDQTLDLNIVGSCYVYATAVQPDGKILIGGSFTTVLGVARNNIARLNTDGTLDTAFNPNANGDCPFNRGAGGRQDSGGRQFHRSEQHRRTDAQPHRPARCRRPAWLIRSTRTRTVMSMRSRCRRTARFLAGGVFTAIGGQTRNSIARLDATTGLADSFDPNANSACHCHRGAGGRQDSGGGDFTSIGGQTRNRIARLDPTTGLADSFNPNANSYCLSIAVQADGKILVGGSFTNIGGQPRNRIARLDPATGLADSFNPNANDYVLSIAVQADGKILAAAVQFANSIGGQTRNHIARLDATGMADSFRPERGCNVRRIPSSTVIQADGKILVGGQLRQHRRTDPQPFRSFDQRHRRAARLAVTPTTVTWTRGGSSPQFTRVTFENSTDNVNYTPLGNGTRRGSNWTLTGLNLPTGQNIYIRARGYYRSGYRNGSESITESVRNVFLNAPLQLATAVSRKTHSGSGDFDIPFCR